MHVGILQFELLIAGAESLKDKRRAVRAAKDRLRHHLGVSVAEVAAQDEHHRAVLGLTVVSESPAKCAEVTDAALRMLLRIPDAQLGEISRRVFRPQDLEPLAPDHAADEQLADELLARGLSFADTAEDDTP